MYFGVLGPVLVLDDEGTAVAVKAASHRGVLALLLADANKVVERDSLAEALWDGQVPGTARTTLATYVSRLRRELGPAAGARIRTQAPGYLIEVAEDEYDVLEMAALERRARQARPLGRHGHVAELTDAALGLWRGKPYQDTPIARLHRDEVPALHAARLRLAELNVAAQLSLGHIDTAVAALTELTAQQPLHEQFAQQLLTALAGQGRRPEALAVYQRTRRALRDQLGLDPGPELEAAHHAVLRSGPAPRPAPPVSGPLPVPRAPAQEAAAVPKPRQLPTPPRGFTGRDEVFAELTAAQSRERAVLALVGPGGVGKTATALAWAHRAAERFPDGQLFVNLHGFDPSGSPASLHDALGGFLQALGVAAPRIPERVADQAALYRTLTADRALLVVLDNAVDSAQVRELLPAGRDCRAIVTSRDRLLGLVAGEGAVPIRLGPLSLEESVGLLEARLGADRLGDRGALRDLAEACGGLPLALTVVAARLALEPDLVPGDLAARLRDDDARLTELSAAEATADVRTVFSWSYRRLGRDAAAMFARLGLHPGTAVSEAAAGCLAELPGPRATAALRELVDAHLLLGVGRQRFQMHDLVRLYAAERAFAELDERGLNEARTRMYDYYLGAAYLADRVANPARELLYELAPDRIRGTGAPADQAEARAWFEAEREVLLELCRRAVEEGFDEHAWQLPWTVAVFLHVRGDWQAMAEVLDRQAKVSEQLDDSYIRARILSDAAFGSFRLGRYEEALERLERADAIFREIGEVPGRARVARVAATVCASQGRHAEHLEYALRAADLARRGGDAIGEAHGLSAVGWAYIQLGGYREAVGPARAALELYERLGDRSGQADVLDTMAQAYERLDQRDEAFELYYRSADLYETLGDRYHHALAYARLARLHAKVGDEDIAEDFRDAADGILSGLELAAEDPVHGELRPAG